MTARVRRGACPCGKTRYRNRKACRAGIDLHRYRFRQQYGRAAPPLWPYRCWRYCGGWHMTSQDPETYTQQRNQAS